jgi:hypothetical protein
MPSTTTKKHLTVIPLGPTFTAEIQGVDFSKPIPPEIKDEIQDAIDEVSGRSFFPSADDSR